MVILYGFLKLNKYEKDFIDYGNDFAYDCTDSM